jgi:1,4-dihydroxy-2-naphthoate octaprenyltransferase
MLHWLRLSRPEFHTVGVFPLLLGVALGHARGGFVSWTALALAVLATVLIMLVTYWTGEVYDYEVDALSATLERNRFSGGTLVLQSTGLPPQRVLAASLLAAALALLIGLWLAWGMGYGPSLFLAGALGGIMGFFYSTPPFRWAYRGLGEIFIAIAYGWLPVAVGLYIATRTWDWPMVLLFGTPAAVSIFLVILINEFPDYPADRRVGKRNLVVRLGRERAARLYVLASLLFALAVLGPVPGGVRAFSFALPMVALALANAAAMARGAWRDRRRLERLCARTILLNVATTLLLSAGVLLT